MLCSFHNFQSSLTANLFIPINWKAFFHNYVMLQVWCLLLECFRFFSNFNATTLLQKGLQQLGVSQRQQNIPTTCSNFCYQWHLLQFVIVAVSVYHSIFELNIYFLFKRATVFGKSCQCFMHHCRSQQFMLWFFNRCWQWIRGYINRTNNQFEVLSSLMCSTMWSDTRMSF